MIIVLICISKLTHTQPAGFCAMDDLETLGFFYSIPHKSVGNAQRHNICSFLCFFLLFCFYLFLSRSPSLSLSLILSPLPFSLQQFQTIHRGFPDSAAYHTKNHHESFQHTCALGAANTPLKQSTHIIRILIHFTSALYFSKSGGMCTFDDDSSRTLAAVGQSERTEYRTSFDSL